MQATTTARGGAAVLATLAAVLAALLVAVAPAQATGPTVFINEFHYVNVGADEGEGVEIAGPAGTDLSGWSLHLYERPAVPGPGYHYGTVLLSGIIPDQVNGIGTLAFPTPLDDGPAGLALVQGPSNVVQFLGYHTFGSFVAADGVANGMATDHIMTNEDPTATQPNHSLQLASPTGTNGTMYGDFLWDTARPNTFGQPNLYQTFTPANNPMTTKTEARNLLADLLPADDPDDHEAISKAINRIDESLNPAWWDGPDALDPVDGSKVFNRERQAAAELVKVVGPTSEAEAAASLLAAADQELAQSAVDAAIAEGGDPGRIADAEGFIAIGDDAAAAGEFPKAIEYYRKAWVEAGKA